MPSTPDVAQSPTAADGRRTTILQAALEVLEARTYGGANVPAVAGAAGVAVGTIYRYFAGKDELYNAVFRWAKGDLLERLTAAVEPRQDPEERFSAVWQALGAWVAERPAAFAFLETQQHLPYLDAESRELSTELDRVALEVIRAGQRAGAVRDDDPHVLVALAFGAFVGLVKAARTAGHEAPEPRAIRTAEHAVWAMLSRPTEETR